MNLAENPFLEFLGGHNFHPILLVRQVLRIFGHAQLGLHKLKTRKSYWQLGGEILAQSLVLGILKAVSQRQVRLLQLNILGKQCLRLLN